MDLERIGLGNSIHTPTSELLTAGGDTRLLCDERGLNKYGCGPVPQFGLLEFGSCTCSTHSSVAMDAAELLHEQFRTAQTAEYASAVSNRIRTRLSQLLLLPSYVDVALAPSGTDAEYLALWLAASRSDRPLVNILIGPTEVGTGTSAAAAGLFYDSICARGEGVNIGCPVNSRLAGNVTTHSIDVRDDRGDIRSVSDIDAEVTEVASKAVLEGAQVLVHVVAHSKTGIHAPSIDCAKRISEHLGDDVVVVVDAAQGRINRRTLHAWLELDSLVIWTASKFFGGPPFVGALLIPPKCLPRDASQLPAEFSSFFTRDDFSPTWQAATSDLSQWTNYGALLRWAAALTEVERFYQTPVTIRRRVLAAFEHLVPAAFAGSDSIQLCPSFARAEELPSKHRGLESSITVYNFTVDVQGISMDRQQLALLHQQANQPLASAFEPQHRPTMNQRIHLGQPVRLSEGRWALRIALGGSMVAQLGSNPSLGDSMDDRIAWLEEQIVCVRKKLELLIWAQQHGCESPDAISRQ